MARCASRSRFPKPGKYHVLVDVYPVVPDTPQLVNFQLTDERDREGRGRGRCRCRRTAPRSRVGGYRVRIVKTPRISAFRPSFVTMRITDAQGRSPHLQPWYGALAHAIFFRAGSLAYFHTHICAPNAPGCASLVGGKALNGTGSAERRAARRHPAAAVRTLAPVPAVPVKGRVMTAPFTFMVH